jgi:hypothetical protein
MPVPSLPGRVGVWLAGVASGLRARTVPAAVALALLIVTLVAVTALAAEPSASPAGLLAGGDPRSGGGGPGLAGSPLGVLLAVIGLGLLTALVTTVLGRWGRR